MTEADQTPVAIVTGGAQGIGRALTQHFLSAGWRVLVLDRDAEAMADLEASLKHPALRGCTADVGEEAAVTAAFAALVEWQARTDQPEGIDLLANNAGIADPVSGPLESLTLTAWRRWQDSHLTGAFLCTRAAIPGLRAHSTPFGHPFHRHPAGDSMRIRPPVPRRFGRAVGAKRRRCGLVTR
ncbi:SDR family oxidoreductase [Thiorhodococcus minor]|uniref:SDR family oxidoreductase n=1 Tax=Thiorhodococcus minor TaxID=57489 RepID=UPI001FD7346A|nr:SDR family oxidoreductase [Thiorhodococcus minor]